jgi:hypothetical protein
MRIWNAFMRVVAAASVGLAMAASIGAARAQGLDQYAGQWGCRYSMEPFSGNALDHHYWEFTIALQPNGQYQMQGFYYSKSLGVQIPVQGQGSWGMTNNGPRGLAISVEGQLFRQDAGWAAFQFIATPADSRNLYLQFRGNTHMTNITCQR